MGLKVITLEQGESLMLGENIVVTNCGMWKEKGLYRRMSARIGVDAPREIRVNRTEKIGFYNNFKQEC